MSDANGVGTPAYIKGVPHPLPPGETVLWQGAPNLRAIATHVFHWRLFAGYFSVMLAWWAIATTARFGTSEYTTGFLMVVALSVLVLGIVWGLSYLVATTTWYAITSHRVVLKIGMVFTMTINVPFSVLESAGVGAFKDGTGQVALRVMPESRIAYVALWPHCHVMRWANPEPVLRGLTNATQVGSLLAKAVADAADHSSRVQRNAVREAAPETVGMPQPAGA